MPDISTAIATDIQRTLPNLRLYDFDLSGVTVAVESVTVGPPTVVNAVPMTLDTGELRNCTDSPQSFRLPAREQTVTESFTVTLSGTVTWTNAIQASVDIPAVASLTGTTSLATSLTAATSFRTDETRTVVFPGQEFVVQECRQLETSVNLMRQLTSGTITYTLLATGTASYRASVPFAVDPRLTGRVFQRIVVTGTYDGVNGYRIQASVNEFDAVCEPGTPCNPERQRLGCTVSAGVRELVGPGIGRDLSTRLLVTGVQGATDGEEFTYEPAPGQVLIVRVGIVERDTRREFDDRGEATISIPLPSAPGRFSFPVPVTVITRGGDRVPFTTFVQTVDVVVRPR